MASLFVDVYPSRAKLTLFGCGNCLVIASTVGAYSLWQMLIRVVPDGRTRSSRNALYDHRRSRFDIAFHGMWAETNPNMRQRFHVSWWHLEVSKSLSASLEHFVCHFSQYGSTWMSNLVFLCKLTIVIPRLPCLFRLAKAVSATVKLVNSVTSDSVNSFNFAMWAVASKCFPVELVPWSDGWRRTWWQTIHMMPGLPVPSIPQCQLNRHEGACLELFQAIGRFEPTSIEAHQALETICKVRSLKSQIKTRSFLDKIITSSKVMFKDFESDMAVGIRNLGNATRKTTKANDTVKQTAGSQILTLQLQAKKSDLWDIACIFVKLYTRTDWKDWPRKTQFGNDAMQFFAV